MNWTEFVHITATIFHAGEYPFTAQEFYENSLLQTVKPPSDLFDYQDKQAPATVDPIVMTIWEHEGPRVAESNEWWNFDEGLWSTENLPLDNDYKLTGDAIRLEFNPITTGVFDRCDEVPQESMLLYYLHNTSAEDVFENHIQDILKLIKKCNKENKSKVYLMTLWSCSNGWSELEYDEDWYLLGAVTPQLNGVQFIPVEDEPDT